ncbi:MAG TPA: polysaccharide biosynthesis/export family protein [Candidatus Angelobacter sp.]|jgi:polysaccharide export outer membrane protein|nr:polysaccharide biosynthesis/export family protein [Candidatus Angelobacter sp.]
MFSLKKQIVLAVVICWIAGAGSLAQTQTANLKTPDPVASDAAKSSDTAKPAEVVPTGYIVGDSDIIRVNVWKEPEVSQTVVVRTDGNISLPLINEVRVSGMTPLQIQDMVAEKLKGFLNSPQVTVTVIEIRSKRAFITGEVARPGTYSLNAQTSVLQLIAQAGGFTPFARKDSIVVLRTEEGRQSRLKFKYKEVVQGKKTEQNITLHPGDTVVVP